MLTFSFVIVGLWPHSWWNRQVHLPRSDPAVLWLGRFRWRCLLHLHSDFHPRGFWRICVGDHCSPSHRSEHFRASQRSACYCGMQNCKIVCICLIESHSAAFHGSKRLKSTLKGSQVHEGATDIQIVAHVYSHSFILSHSLARINIYLGVGGLRTPGRWQTSCPSLLELQGGMELRVTIKTNLHQLCSL